MSAHYNIKNIISFQSREEARKYMVENDLSPVYWTEVVCNCDNLTRAERLAMNWPRLFGWLLKREFEEEGE